MDPLPMPRRRPPPGAGTPVAGGSELAALWSLDPACDFLNHGSYGACPTVVLEAQAEWRARLERQPVAFLVRELEPALDAVAEQLGRVVGARPEDLAFVPNATTGVSTVLAGLALAPGDELLCTSHGYAACGLALQRVAARSGATVVTVVLPFPVTSEEALVAPWLAAVTPRTRLALIDHVTSPTALILPVARLVAEFAARGVDVLVDGAHAPGQVPLDLDALGAAYFTGNAHKWLCAPKGTAFLHVRRDRQSGLSPLVTSHGAGSLRRDRSRFRLEFGWTGTFDPSAWLALGTALDFLQGLFPGGLEELRARNNALVCAGRRMLLEAVPQAPPAPESMLGAMASVILPPGPSAAPAAPPWVEPLGEQLFAAGLEVPVMSWPVRPGRLLRISAQAYNAPRQYQRLAQTLVQLLAAEQD